jgi:hypothetical protein
VHVAEEKAAVDTVDAKTFIGRIGHARGTLTAFQSLFTIAALIFGGAWAIYTWCKQLQDRKAGEIPALEIRIFAKQQTLKNQEDLLGKGVYLIRGFVTVKNVGSSKTSLQLCECKTAGTSIANVQLCYKHPTDEIPQCAESQREGPLVVSRVSLKDGKMGFGTPERFWLTNPSRPENTPDEVRPQATDRFEFLVPVTDLGLYAIMFTAPVDEEERARMKDWNRWPRWEDITFAEVKKDEGNEQASGASTSPKTAHQNPI